MRVLGVEGAGGKVCSFEPLPEHVGIYRENFKLNGRRPLVVPCGVEFSPKVNKATMTLPLVGHKRGERFINYAKSTLINRWSRPHPTIEVDVISFEEATRRAQKALRSQTLCLKVDAEGVEGDLLEFGDLTPFCKLFFEYHYTQVDPKFDRAPRIVERLQEYGFEVKLSKPLRAPRWWNDSAFLCWAKREL